MITHFRGYTMEKISLLVMLMCCIALRAMDDGNNNGKTVVTVELDGVVSNQQEVGLTDFASMGKYFSLLRHAWLLTRFSELKEDFSKIEADTHGMGNRFHTFVGQIRTKHKVDLSKYTSDLVKRSTKPIPNPEVIALLRKIRERGDVVMGATDMDWEHFEAYRDKMDDHQVDLNDLFGGIVVTRFNYLEVESNKQEEALWTEVEKEVYMIINPNSVKPTDDFFKVAGEVVRHYHPDAQRLIHIDTTAENVAAARRNDFKSILFTGSADDLKKQFHGFSID